VILKREKEILNNQVKMLKRTLREMDFKFSTFLANQSDINASASHLEFEEVNIDDILKVAEEQTAMEEYSVISENSVNYIDIPLDTEVVNSMSPYATEVRDGLACESSISKEMTIYHFKNQLV
jgi:hypothetical protein